MRDNDFIKVTCGSFLAGILIGFFYINPYSGEISFLNIILQLSGRRDMLPMGVSLPELIDLAMKMAPSYIAECFLGIHLYKKYCVADVYIFSRYTHRKKWYMTEILKLGIYVMCFLVSMFAGAVMITGLRYTIDWNFSGAMLILYYLIIWTLWIWTMSVAINCLSIFLGSSYGYMSVICFQMGMIVLISLANGESEIFKKLLPYDPICHLILDWHESSLEKVNELLSGYHNMGDLNGTVIYESCIWIVVFFAGMYIVCNKDIIVSNMEEG